MDTEVAEALSRARSSRGDLAEDEWNVFLTEHSAFNLRPSRNSDDSVWGTYFAPMMTFTTEDGKRIMNSGLSQLRAESIEYWQGRAEQVSNPVMKARYRCSVGLSEGDIQREAKPQYGKRRI